MQPITLRIAGKQGAELPLAPGVHALARGSDGAIARVEDPQTASLCFCVDRRGVWLTVGDTAESVHVNGRPVRRMAMLRVGDSVHAAGAEMVIASIRVPGAPGSAQSGLPDSTPHDPRVVLRGVGGRHHGRSFTLDSPKLVGSDKACDIRVDDPAFSARHCRIGLEHGVLVLRDLGSEEGSIVNGCPVRDALLHPGDQIVFDAYQRFVVEAPAGDLVREQDLLPFHDDQQVGDPAQTARNALGRSARRLPWLLLAALLIAAALSALLLLGVPG